MNGKVTKKLGVEAQKLITLLERCSADRPSDDLRNNQCLEISGLALTDLVYRDGLGLGTASC